MDKITDVLLNWQVLLISFAVFALLGILRALGTKKDPKTGEAMGGWAECTWFRRFLPIYPYLLSTGIVFIPGVPLPDQVGKTLAVKIMYALYAGWLSDKVYQIIKHYLEERGVHLDELAAQRVPPSLPPPPPAPEKPVEEASKDTGVA